jgi:hypothetical protein
MRSLLVLIEFILCSSVLYISTPCYHVEFTLEIAKYEFNYLFKVMT